MNEQKILDEINKMKLVMANLQRAFIESQKCNVETVAKADSVAMVDSKVDTVNQQVVSIETNVSGNYDSTKAYSFNEYCNYNGNLYRFDREVGQGIVPTNSNYWTLCDIATELNRLVNLINKQ